MKSSTTAKTPASRSRPRLTGLNSQNLPALLPPSPLTPAKGSEAKADPTTGSAKDEHDEPQAFRINEIGFFFAAGILVGYLLGRLLPLALS